jgi:DNA-binding NtrC family response regulator
VEDIPLLINHFLDLFSANHPISIAGEAVDLLMKYPWPGNVRELENVMERLVTVRDGGDITVEDIPVELKLPTHICLNETLGEISFHEIIRSTERELITWAMEKAEGNKTQAAKLLKMKPSTFRDTLAKHSGWIEPAIRR